MKNTKNNLLKTLGNRPILIWGARMTGIGFLRFAKKHNLNVVGFVDSDKSFEKTSISSFPISKPEDIAFLKGKYKDLIIVIDVSIKEDEIVSFLKKFGASEKDYVAYSDFCGCFFTVDVSGVCNLKCPSCAHTMKEIKNPKGFMSSDDFKEIIDKIIREVDLVSHICLYSWGEPFLHPKLDLFIEYIHEKGIATAVSTNLSISSVGQIEKIIKSAPDYLKISLSGFYPQTYNQTHSGGELILLKRIFAA